ncbi:hypothetical protein C2W62_29000 [Candidatus Entotheonella serta]|nr:hypothetical protein C2W62_29000 [Candidatus Entotheonella serta]
MIGLDIGSTTVKAVVVDADTKTIVWRDYQRHETRQAEKVLELLLAIEHAFANLPTDRFRILVTGSGAGPLMAPLGAKFVQEVNAVTLAVDDLHPDAGSVIELGGLDAKIIIYQAHPDTGAKRAIASMNDKCASGTGATIDKCILKVGLEPDALAELTWEPSKLHRVAAKCGVFAETDIVNLVKAGIPASEIMFSLADAIVMQNLSVLSRGNTLRHRVLLLGGPNAYLPFLQDCWRQRIPETWAAKGYAYPIDHDIADLITVPEHALYYAAYGAVIYGLYEGPEVGRFAGLEGLRNFIAHGRQAALGHSGGPPLIRSQAELNRFRARYTIPPFVSATWPAGWTVQGVIGLDGGSTSSKAVLLGTDGTLLHKAYQLSQGNPIADMQTL